MTPQFNKKYTKEEFFNPDFQEYLRKNMPVGKIRVDSNADGEGQEVELFYYISTYIGNEMYFSSYITNQTSVGGINYAFDKSWKYDYTGTFTLLNPYNNIKPELYQVGDIVEVLENIKDCKDFYDCIPEKQESIGKTFKIKYVFDSHYDGICYLLENDYRYAHHCLKKVNSVNSTDKQEQDLIEKIKKLEAKIEELDRRIRKSN